LIKSSKKRHQTRGKMKLNKKPKSPRDILKRNILKGKLGERVAKKDYRKNGFDLSVTGKGSDFIAEKKRRGYYLQGIC